ncbi:tripartite tricarboxylate transporter substrate binding protein [Achromobacter sp. GG226]|uniref:Bug family tripartite tricarboxylate transporter substrate binding protein n=1 Tax=Verticiella alkaliphila TaxID=2779529 RepID=UPI001C0D5B91|nr:tripartite tricarboxylate transporter substrate binding protein [Verticiella sp. GG226]MBU4610772.1 tripartite tricarboxylate transporter substrate binding protein [Verticiella sp. GG226]
MAFRLSHLTAALALASAALAGGPAVAAEWPQQKPITLVVPFAAGGTSDVLGRAIGQELGKELGQTVLIENRGGAGGVLGADNVAKSKPDGYTLLLGTIATHAINPALLPSIAYDAKADFTPVMRLGNISNVLLVSSGQPYQSVKELVDAAKGKPGEIAFGSAGQGTSQHLSGEVFKLLTGAELTHVPYRGSAPAVQDLIGGQIPTSFETVLVAAPHLSGGKIRALAVTSAARSPIMPDVPTMQEAGVDGFDVSSWQAVYAPAGTPEPIVTRLNETLAKIFEKPEMKKRVADLGMQYTPNTPAEFAEFQAAEQAKWAKIIKDGNVQVNN